MLLAMKKRGFGTGRWNGMGGKVEGEESVRDSVCREVREEVEVAVRPEDLTSVAELDFYFKEKPDWDFHVSVFAADRWEGEPQETEEMKPQWFTLSDIPYADMWPTDREWVPHVLAGKKIRAAYRFLDDGNTFERLSFEEVDSLQ